MLLCGIASDLTPRSRRQPQCTYFRPTDERIWHAVAGFTVLEEALRERARGPSSFPRDGHQDGWGI
jgi:hypothetical protein